ncbi:leukemia NUP98 fusion partner 1 [Brachyhypopomus gauderio]|uniref:leukemia NUP98 fusion partner 1 n=1 Tax=Brachyhypopomus gauderio TaxID=698409 RepID=UPI0040425660
MDNEDDDDGNFTKWMSSYWGHGSGEDRAKEKKRSFRRPRRPTDGRRASMPCMSQLESSQLKQLHTATMLPSPSTEERAHPRPRRVSSDDNSWTTGSGGGPVPGLSESFEMLHLRKHRIMSLNDANNACLICHEKLCNGGAAGGAQSSHYSQRLHREVTRPGQEARPRSVSTTTICERRKEVREETRLPWHQLPLRRQR